MKGDPVAFTLNVNGKPQVVEADEDTPLLYVLRDELGLNGAKYGCGVGQCGACTVLSDGVPLRACFVPAASLTARKITTLEGLRGADGKLHALNANEQSPALVVKSFRTGLAALDELPPGGAFARGAVHEAACKPTAAATAASSGRYEERSSREFMNIGIRAVVGR